MNLTHGGIFTDCCQEDVSRFIGHRNLHEHKQEENKSEYIENLAIISSVGYGSYKIMNVFNLFVKVLFNYTTQSITQGAGVLKHFKI